MDLVAPHSLAVLGSRTNHTLEQREELWRRRIKVEIDGWIECCKEIVMAERDFSSYPDISTFLDATQEEIDLAVGKKEEILRALQVEEVKLKHRLAMQIFASTSIDELDELDIDSPWQIIG